MLKHLMIAGVIWAAGCATSSAERINDSAAAKLAEYDRTGEVTSCMNLRQISTMDAVDERTLLIKTGVSDYYVSDLKGRCSGATSSFNRFEYSTSSSQLCQNEIIRIVDNSTGFLTGSCGMGSFEKLAKKAPAETPAQTPAQ